MIWDIDKDLYFLSLRNTRTFLRQGCEGLVVLRTQQDILGNIFQILFLQPLSSLQDNARCLLAKRMLKGKCFEK